PCQLIKLQHVLPPVPNEIILCIIPYMSGMYGSISLCTHSGFSEINLEAAKYRLYRIVVLRHHSLKLSLSSYNYKFLKKGLRFFAATHILYYNKLIIKQTVI